MDRERDRDYGPERRRGGRSRSRSLSPSPRSLQHDRRPSSPTPAPTRPRKIAEQTEITRAAAKTPRAATKQTTIASSLPDAEPGASKSNARHATEVKLAVAVKKVPATSGSLASTTIEQGTAKSLGLGASNVPPEAGREAGSARAGDKGLSIAKVTTAKTSAKDLKTATPETNSATAGEAVEAPSRPDKKAEAEGAASGATGDRLQAKLAGAPRVPEVGHAMAFLTRHCFGSG